MKKPLNIKTSYFAKYRESNGVSVARGTPKWFEGEKIPEFFPSWKIIHQHKDGEIGDGEYTEIYIEEVLNKIDINDILGKIKGKVLLCFEKQGEFCHRRIVAKWIEDKTGESVPEYEGK